MTASDINVVVVDDHVLFARGLELLVNAVPERGIRVVATTDVPHHAVDLVRRWSPDVALVDLAMPGPGGVEVVRNLRQKFPELRILVLSGVTGIDGPVAALHAGADGFVPKTSEPEALLQPLFSVLGGWQVVPAALLRELIHRADRPGAETVAQLDADERDLWRRIASGESTADLARRLHLSERSAKRSVASLLRKLRVGNRIEAAALAGRCGLLDQDDPPPASRPSEARSWPRRAMLPA